MILDNEEQRNLILNALVNVPIQGDYAGITNILPQFAQVIEAVKNALIGEYRETNNEISLRSGEPIVWPSQNLKQNGKNIKEKEDGSKPTE